MKRTASLLLVAFGLSLCASQASAHGRARVGVYVGAPIVLGGSYWGGSYWYGGHYRPWYGPLYSPYPYYPPTIVTVPAPQPPVYIEQAPAPVAPAPAQPVPQAQSAPSGFWYYCGSPEGYYPYVKECPGGWLPVAAQPANIK